MTENTNRKGMNEEMDEEDILDLGIDFGAVAACVAGKDLTEDQKAECEKYLQFCDVVRGKLNK